LLAVVATIHFIDMVLDTRKTYLDAVIVEKRKAITANLDIGEHFTRITNQNKNYTNIKEAPGGASQKWNNEKKQSRT